MLKSLRIRNLATIEDLEIGFESGFTILTGETGAGKSILIDAIRLALGEKGSADYIRTGQTEASIEAVFAPPAPGASSSSSDIEDEVLIQRQINGQGSGKVYIDGVLAPVRKLKETTDAFADIYGQNDHIFLLHLENHLLYLDAFLDAAELRKETSDAAGNLQFLIQEKRRLESRRRERSERLDILAFQIQEIDDARLSPGEEEELAGKREFLRNREKISLLIEQALDLSYAQEESIIPLLSKYRNVVKELVPFLPPSVGLSVQPVEDFTIVLRELSDSLMKFQDANAEASDSLEAVEERLSVIDKLKRKYGPDIPAILALREKLGTERLELLAGEELLENLETVLAQAFERYVRAAGKLSDLRKKGAAALEKSLAVEFALLGMKKAVFKVDFQAVPPSLPDPASIRETGMDTIEFLISPNPGENPKPLRKIASGGELSRVMLALKAIGKDSESSRTLIFDEIDSGIGGKTADCVADKLKQLAAKHQVICITHLPQIAAAAVHHFRIEKSFDKSRTFTKIMRLDPESRVEEIARLISGTRVTEAALQTAREMLAGTGHPLSPNPKSRR